MSYLKVLLVAACCILQQGCAPKLQTDFIREGSSQDKLRRLIADRIDVSISDDIVVTLAFSSGFREHEMWFGIELPEKRGIEEFSTKGLRLNLSNKEVSQEAPTVVLDWMTSSQFEGAEFFSISDLRQHLLIGIDDKRGLVLIRSVDL